MEREIVNPETGARLVHAPRPDAKGLVVVCPGGGYRFVSTREAGPVARAFAEAGWQAFVLHYSVGEGPLGTTPLREAAWAAGTARDLDEGRGRAGRPLILCGFSAGGHLAASLGTHWNDAALFPDPRSRRRQRPDALVLGYPVITGGVHRHADSFRRLVGEGGDTRYFSLEKQVTADTPPAFIWHTAEDRTVPARNSLLFAEALMEQGTPVELRIYPFGVHGLSLATPEVEQPEEGRLADPHVAGWFRGCAAWLDAVFAGRGD